MKKLLAGLSVLLGVSCWAHDITLAWNPSTDATVTGYRIYYAQVGQGLTNVWNAGMANITTVPGLTSSTDIQYRFTCVAVNAAGVESPPTLELVSVIPPHSVNFPRFVGRTGSQFTLAWLSSDEPDAKTYKITYGTVNPWTTNVVTVAHPITTATVTAGLVPGAEHYFDFTVINNPGVESWPKYQLRDKLLPAGPPDLKIGVVVR
jgi:hypothetical protein